MKILCIRNRLNRFLLFYVKRGLTVTSLYVKTVGVFSFDLSKVCKTSEIISCSNLEYMMVSVHTCMLLLLCLSGIKNNFRAKFIWLSRVEFFFLYNCVILFENNVTFMWNWCKLKRILVQIPLPHTLATKCHWEGKAHSST